MAESLFGAELLILSLIIAIGAAVWLIVRRL